MQKINSSGFGRNNFARRSLLAASRLSYLVLLAVGWLLLDGCAEPKVGCLHIAATNFAADADDPCEDCCTFPNLEIQLLHQIARSGELVNLRYDSTYTINGTAIRIKDIRYILSDFELIRADGTTATVLDQIVFRVPNSPGDTTSITRANDFIIVNANNFQSLPIANYRESGNFVGIRFKIGVSEPANRVNPTSLTADHPLRADSLFLGPNSGYVFNQFSFIRDTTTTAPCEVVKISGASNIQTVQLDTAFTAQESFNIQIAVAVDYTQWLKNVAQKYS